MGTCCRAGLSYDVGLDLRSEGRQLEWRPFSLGDTAYDLSHLHPRTCQYEQAAKGEKPARTYCVDVLFSLHCFTRGFTPSEKPDRSLFYSDDRETRVFDFQRYALSKRLPAIIDHLAHRKCYHTGKGNFFSVEVIDESGTLLEYDIFFTASRSSKRGVVNLFVQSAYVRDPTHRGNRPHMKPIGLPIILFNVLQNKSIRPPK